MQDVSILPKMSKVTPEDVQVLFSMTTLKYYPIQCTEEYINSLPNSVIDEILTYYVEDKVGPMLRKIPPWPDYLYRVFRPYYNDQKKWWPLLQACIVQHELMKVGIPRGQAINITAVINQMSRKANSYWIESRK